jgi:hypothetical protein
MLLLKVAAGMMARVVKLAEPRGIEPLRGPGLLDLPRTLSRPHRNVDAAPNPRAAFAFQVAGFERTGLTSFEATQFNRADLE